MKTMRDTEHFESAGLPPAGPDEPRVAAALEEYLAAAEAGTPPDRDEFLARHPDIAAALAGCLAGLDLLDAAGRGQSAAHRHATAGAAHELARGALGDFRILREVGRGGMGVVYEAEQLSLGRRVALKVLPLAGTLDPKHLQRFRNEAQAAAHLHHPNVVPVYAVGCERGVHYYAMQFIDGRNLADVIREQQVPGRGPEVEQDFSVGPAAPGERPAPAPTAPYVPGAPAAQPGAETSRAPGPAALTVPTGRGRDQHRAAVRLAIQAAEALDYAHQMGVVHRDVKPANLIVDGRGNLWVTDFGLAQFQANPGLTQTGDLFGTLRYMSPEQALALRGVVDHRTDVYSLGVTLYELLALTPAAPGTDRQELLHQVVFEDPVPPRRIDPTIPAEVETIVLKAVAKAPEERYATAQEFADDLRRFLEDRPILARPPSRARRLVKWARRHKPLVSALAVAAALLLAGLVGLLGWFAVKEGRLADERGAFARDREEARKETAARLYRAKLDHAAALRLARTPGYRAGVWADLRDAAALDVPGRDGDEVRGLALACLGDPVGLPAADPAAVRRPAAVPVPAAFEVLVRGAKGARPAAWAVTPGGDLLALSPATGRVALRGRDGEVLAEAASPLGGVYDLGFTPDGQLLLGGCEQGAAAWSVPSLTPRPLVRGGNVHSVAAHPHGRLVALSGRQVELWSLASNRPVTAFPAPGPGTKVEFTGDGRFLLAVRGDAVVAAWPVLDTPEKRALPGHAGGVPGLAFSPDGAVLASAGKDRTMKVWDAATGALVFAGPAHEAAVESMAFSPDGRLLAGGDFRGDVRVWDWRAGREVARVAGPGQVWRLAFGPAGRFLAAAGEGGVAAWAVRPAGDGVGLEAFLKIDAPGTIDLAVHPNGAELALLDRGGRLSAYDLRRAALPRPLGQPARPEVRSLAFDASGTGLAFVNPDGLLAVLGWPSGAVRLTGARAFQVARGPGGWVATPAADGAVAVHDLGTDRGVFTLPAEEGDVWGLAFGPDGRRLAVGRSDGGVAVWDLAEVRTRLAEFGADVSPPPGTGPAPTPPTAAEFEETVRRDKARTELNEVEAKAAKAWAARDYAAARGLCLRALALRELLGQTDPADEEDRYRLVGVHATLGTAHLQFRDFDAARRQFDRELALAEKLSADFPAVPKYRESMATAHYNTALVLRATGRDREAVAEFRKAIPLREALAAEFPGQPRQTERLALTYSNLGVLLAKAGDDREAEACYRRALALFGRLAEDFPDTPDHPVYRKHLAAARHNLGMLLARTGRPVEAEGELRAAVEMREKLVADEPGSADCHSVLALSLEGLGVLLRTRDGDEAVRLLRRAVEEGREAVRLAPGNPGYRRACGDHSFNLSDSLRLLGRHADSVRAAAELAAFAPADPRELVRAARLTARCVPVAAADPALSALGRGLLPELYAMQAVALLEKAATAGAKGLDALARDPDFAPLRSRPDFQKLVTKPPG